MVSVSGPKGPAYLTADGIVWPPQLRRCQKSWTLQPDRKVFFDSIRYSATAVAVRHYQATRDASRPAPLPSRARSDGPLPPLLAPTRPARITTASSTHFIKCYASGDLGPQLPSASDREIMDTLAPDKLLRDPALANCDATELQRWPEALPLFEPGHFQRLRQFAAGRIEDPHTPVVFAGDYLGGPFIEGAITSGQQAADRLLARLSKAA